MEASNVKAMREALLKAIILLKVCEWPHDAPMQDIAEVIDEIEKASSAPPRNCDRPECQSQTDAQKVWKHEDGGKTAYYDWLLAPAGEGGEK